MFLISQKRSFIVETVPKENKSSRTLVGVAGIVAVATLLSKVVALVRQQAIATAFGLGDAYNAFKYAYLIPSFFWVLLGGVNGPIHSAIISVLAKRNKQEAVRIVETTTTVVSGVTLLITIILYKEADFFIQLVGPLLNQTTQAIAAQQLRILAPMVLLAGAVGVGFGTLNLANQYWLISISPILSSITTIIGIGVLALQIGPKITRHEYALIGGLVLAWSTLAGAISQWLVQLITQWRLGLGTIRLRFDFNSPGVHEAMRIMTPATFSSGTMQINLYTDMYFVSPITGAAAAFDYANLLVQTPLGIISNTMLLPILPIFSALAASGDWINFKLKLRQVLIVAVLSTLPLGALFVALANPIVRVVYERGAFDKNASQLVASILMAHGIGMVIYLCRDILVRVFYALGDGTTPFRISIINIFLNAILDYILVKPFGVPGITLATVGVNFTSIIMLLWLLNRKLDGLPILECGKPILGLLVGSIAAGGTSWATLQALEQILGNTSLLILLLQLCLSAIVGMIIFIVIAKLLNLPEIDIVVSLLRKSLARLQR